MLFAWAPAVPLVLASLNMFHGITQRKATGLGAVAGSLAEAYVTAGLGLTIVLEFAAIVLLVRALTKESWTRSIWSVVSIGMSGLVLSIAGLFCWLVYFGLPHMN